MNKQKRYRPLNTALLMHEMHIQLPESINLNVSLEML